LTIIGYSTRNAAIISTEIVVQGNESSNLHFSCLHVFFLQYWSPNIREFPGTHTLYLRGSTSLEAIFAQKKQTCDGGGSMG